jgi:outer membrane biosynthesis protein TonB
LLALLGGYALSIATLAVLLLAKGIPNVGLYAVDVHGARVLVAGYHWQLLDSELLFRVAEATFRAWLVVTAVMTVVGLIWWLVLQTGEQQASFVFSAVLHFALVFMTYELFIPGDPFVWPGPRSMTGAYIITRIEETKPEEKKTLALKKNEGEQAEKSPEPPKKTATKGDEGKMGGEGKVERARTPKPNESKAPPRVGLIQDKNRKVLDNIINPQAKMDYGQFAGIQGEQKRGDQGFGQGKGTGVGKGEGTGTTRNSNGKGTGGGGQSENDFVSDKGKVDAGKAKPGGGNCATPPCGVSPKLVAVASDNDVTEGSGLTAEEINKEIRKRAGVFRSCYQRELNHQPQLAGKLVMHFTIGTDGGVKNVRTASGSTLRNEAVEECVNRNINMIHFRSTDKISNVNYPFVFSQGG